MTGKDIPLNYFNQKKAGEVTLISKDFIRTNIKTDSESHSCNDKGVNEEDVTIIISIPGNKF